MNNYIYILSNQQNISVEKLHICTWDIRNQKASVELGLMIVNRNLPNNFDLYVFAPFLKTNCEISSLHNKLHEASNFKFIFNEEVTNDQPLDTGRTGHIVHYTHDTHAISMAIINVMPERHDGHIKIPINKPVGNYTHIYVRLLIKTQEESLANTSSGSINKKIYKYDLKVNEYRNEPETIINSRQQNQLSNIQVKAVYFLNCVPDNYELSYVDNRKLQSVRLLEMDAFRHYLEDLNSAEGDYIIAFQKDDIGNSFSFFTAFSKEHIGNHEIILAVLANILCTMLFEALPDGWMRKDGFWEIPNYVWVTIVILLLVILYCVYGKSLYKRIRKRLKK